MKNPLIWIVLALVLGGTLLWFGGREPDTVDPLAAVELPEVRTEETVPAELVQPAANEVIASETTSDEPAVQVAGAEAISVPSIAPEREAIEVELPIEIRGRIVDEATGEGVEGFTVSLGGSGQELLLGGFDLPLFQSGGLVVPTDATGNFTFELSKDEAAKGPILFVLPLDGWAVTESERALTPHELEFGADLHFTAKRWPPPSAGNVSGSLRAETGSFPPDAVPRTNHILLDLVSTALPAIERRAQLTPILDDEGGVTFSFLFEDVPEGEYELTLSSLGNYRWTPVSMLVVPPAAGLEFLRFDLDDTLPLVFEVLDAESGEAITDFEARHIKQTNSAEHGVLLHTGPVESEQFPRDEAFTWSVEAAGYAVAYGDESAFNEEEQRRVAVVRLQRGWSTRLLVMGGPRGTRPQPLAGADVYVSGEFAGRSGSNGELLMFAEEEPESLEVRYLDWELADEISTAKRRSNVTPVILIEPQRD